MEWMSGPRSGCRLTVVVDLFESECGGRGEYRVEWVSLFGLSVNDVVAFLVVGGGRGECRVEWVGLVRLSVVTVVVSYVPYVFC